MHTIALAVLLATATTGSGVSKTEKRPLDAFTAVAAAGSFEVDVVLGDKPGAEVTADDNVLALIVTTVDKDGKLSIHPKDGDDFTSKTPVVVKVSAQKLTALSQKGSGKLLAADVPAHALALALSGSGALSWKGPAESFTAAVNGSGQLTVAGAAPKLDVSVNGSGTVDAANVDSADVSATINGSGRANVKASTTLNATINGSGKVSYTGAAKVTKSVRGSGTVEAAH